MKKLYLFTISIYDADVPGSFKEVDIYKDSIISDCIKNNRYKNIIYKILNVIERISEIEDYKWHKLDNNDFIKEKRIYINDKNDINISLDIYIDYSVILDVYTVDLVIQNDAIKDLCKKELNDEKISKVLTYVYNYLSEYLCSEINW